MRLQDASNCPDNRCGPNGDRELLRQAKASGNTATGFLLAGGLLLLGGALLYFLAPPDGARVHAPRIVPMVGASAAGLAVDGTLF